MVTSIDGRLHPSRFTTSPDGTKDDWSKQYEKVHASLNANAWLVGRITMAEMSKAGTHPPSNPGKVERPIHIADRAATSFAVALDPSAKLHFKGGSLSGDHVVVLLGKDTPDSHLAELAADGVSYVVSSGPEVDIPGLLDTLAEKIRHQAPRRGGRCKNEWRFPGGPSRRRVAGRGGPGARWRGHNSGIVDYRDGLAGLVQLKFKAADVLDHGAVLLVYTVLPPAA